jgi:hypothetical protein
MPQETKVAIQIPLSEFKQHFGEKSWDSALKMAQILKDYLNNGSRFTGKIVFTVNCSNGGIGNVEAFVQRKI